MSTREDEIGRLAAAVAAFLPDYYSYGSSGPTKDALNFEADMKAAKAVSVATKIYDLTHQSSTKENGQSAS